MKQRTMSCIVMTVAIFVALWAGRTGAQDTRGNLPGKLYLSLPPQEESVIDRTAANVLQHIVQARTDISRQDPEKARRELDETQRLMTTVRDNLSSSVARERILKARHSLESEPAKKVVQDISAIYASFDAIAEYLPTDKARQHVDLARNCLERDDKRCAERELDFADRCLAVVEVERPLARTAKYVREAQDSLAGKDTRKADLALQQAETTARAISANIESPLYRARQSIWQAGRQYSAGKQGEAGAYLEQGRRYLEKFGTTANAREKEEAGRLAREVAELEKKVGEKAEGVETGLKVAWERSAALAERGADYLVAGWQEMKTTLAASDDLIEAKLHVAYAETYQVTAGEPDKAARELGKATSFLKKAMQSKLAGREDIQKMADVEKELATLRTHPERRDRAVQDRYAAIMVKLRSLLQSI